MPRLPCLPEDAHLGHVFQKFPRGAMELGRFSDILLRGESELTIGEREMLAAFVSGLNACNFCHENHKVIAELHGVDPAILESLLNSHEESGLDEKWRPLFAYLRKLTESPSRITDADAQSVLDAGFSEAALFDAISVCALFNFMNRIVEGCGVQFNLANLVANRERHKTGQASDSPYSDFMRMHTGAQED